MAVSAEARLRVSSPGQSRAPRLTVPFSSDEEYDEIGHKAMAEGLSVAQYLRAAALDLELSPNSRVVRELVLFANKIQDRYAPHDPQYRREYAEILIAITEAILRVAKASAP